MNSRLMLGIGVVSAVFLVSFSTFGQAAPQAGAPKAKPAASSAPFDPHDLSGVWQYSYETTLPTIGPDKPPMTPWGQAKYDAAKPGYGPKAAPGGNDPIFDCDPPSLPRLIIWPNPMQFVMTPGRVYQFFEWTHQWRGIWTDGQHTLPKDPDSKWMGYSVGHWDGDSFVVDTVGLDERSWVDETGNPHSDQMHLTERYRRASHDGLQIRMTIDDPKTYTKVWEGNTKTFKLLPTLDTVDEFFCVYSEEHSFTEKIRDPAVPGYSPDKQVQQPPQ